MIAHMTIGMAEFPLLKMAGPCRRPNVRSPQTTDPAEASAACDRGRRRRVIRAGPCQNSNGVATRRGTLRLPYAEGSGPRPATGGAGQAPGGGILAGEGGTGVQVARHVLGASAGTRGR